MSVLLGAVHLNLNDCFWFLAVQYAHFTSSGGCLLHLITQAALRYCSNQAVKKYLFIFFKHS